MKNEFTLAPIFQNNMVFQAEKPLYIFGACEPKITLEVMINNDSYQFYCDSDKFCFELKALPIIKKPFYVKIKSNKQEVVISNCLAGDVYLCTGQSNMQYLGKDVLDTVYQDLPNLRLYEVPKLPYIGAENEFDWLYTNDPKWYEASKESEENFSAIGYMIGRDIVNDHDIPIGIVSCNNGDTTIYSWLDKEVIKENDVLKTYLENYDSWQKNYESFQAYDQYYKKQVPVLMNFYGLLDQYREQGLSSDEVEKKAHEKYPNPYLPMGPKNQNRPGGCYDTMLSSIIPYANKGIIYYQGENDVSRPKEYKVAIRKLIKHWRKDFNDDLPFIICQIAGYIYPNIESRKVAELRDAQASMADIKNKQFVVTAVDQGEANNIHPGRKAIVAKRIYNVVNEYIYQTGKNSLSPMIKDFHVIGNQIIISRRFNPLNLLIKNKTETGFSGIDIFNNRIPLNKVSISLGHIIIDGISDFKEIQYGYESFPVLCIYTENDLPLLPFKINLY